MGTRLRRLPPSSSFWEAFLIWLWRSPSLGMREFLSGTTMREFWRISQVMATTGCS